MTITIMITATIMRTIITMVTRMAMGIITTTKNVR
jgi:hypothetical protein